MYLTSNSLRSTLKTSPANLDNALDVQVMDKLYSIQEVATKLGLSDKTLRRWEEAGRFSPSRTLGNQRRYSLEDLQILDAIKHGTINEQKDLLTVDQAGQLCGVSSATILRWENEGKVHPFITSGNTYYPRAKLMEKMAELKKSYVEPELETATERDNPKVSNADPAPKLSLLTPPPAQHSIPHTSYSIHIAITLILILSYHLIFNQSSAPVSPQVQGVATTNFDPRLDDLITKFQDFVTQENLKDAKPTPVTTINLDNTSLVTGTSTLPKGKNQISVPSDKLTASTPVTATFTSDFSPAKKYWITTTVGSFTLHTDFPPGADSTFNYSFLTPTATPSTQLR